MLTINFNATKVINGEKDNITSHNDFSIETSSETIDTGTTIENNSVYGDAKIDTLSDAEMVRTLLILPTIETATIGVINYTSSVCNSNANIVSSTVTGETGVIGVSVNGKRPIRVVYPTYVIPIASADIVGDYTVGTLAKHITEKMKSLIDGLTPDINTFSQWLPGTHSNKETTNPTMTPNPNLFCKEFDLSGMSVANNLHRYNSGPIALISPRHGLIADHMLDSIGKKWVFRRPNGEFQTVSTLLKSNGNIDFLFACNSTFSHNTDNPPCYSDLGIVYFDADVTGCTLIDVVPHDIYTKYMPSLVPTTGFNNDNKPGVPYLRKAFWNIYDKEHGNGGCFQVALMGGINSEFVADAVRVNRDARIYTEGGSNPGRHYAPYKGWYKAYWDLRGDSGGTCFYIINNKPVMFGTTAGQGGCADIAKFSETEINRVMNLLATNAGDPLAGSYEVGIANLTGFTEFT